MSESLTIMVAPNGARRTKADHPAIPVTVEETAHVVAACAEAGAQAAHLHVRDAEQRHLLDADAYLAVIEAVKKQAPSDFVCQVTTEAVGRYSPAEQMAVVRGVKPEAVSIAVKELVPNAAAEAEAGAFYEWCRREEIAVQHILYDTDDMAAFYDLCRRGVIPGDKLGVLFVLGRYSTNQESDANMLRPFLEMLDKAEGGPDLTWMICAFGLGETAGAAAAMTMGGHVRVGFENSLWTPQGDVTPDNVETVARSRRIATELGRMCATREQTLQVLGAF
ncbi:3-keto-5-aminohexanoate cleavage protein [Breoghania sp.]|uniref:3-keto-5-aminohexanoate cleavage protein n=1 Tax=Breoghania sp. TaxID=2065378 RepID=UPI002AA8893A|nr:3-keto-5-aminohexanoate cleavage protein [Breoghania sp.]